MLSTVSIYNDKGNVSATARKAIKDKAVAKLTDVLEAGFTGDTVTGADGALYVHIFNDENGNPIYLRLEATVSTKDPATPVKERAVKETAKTEIVIPDLV